MALFAQPSKKWQRVLPVHTLVLLNTTSQSVEKTRQLVKDAMETLPKGFTVPLKVDIKIGRTWADCK